MKRTTLCLAAAALVGGAAHAQDAAGWQACAANADAGQRLACFDRWAAGQQPAPATTLATPAPAQASERKAQAPASGALPGSAGLRFTTLDGCHDVRFSDLSRFWELEPGTNCDTFGIRVFHPMSMDLARGGSVNGQPTSDNPLNNALSNVDYRRTEVRLQVSVRTKVAQDLLTRDRPDATDSIWFAYSQQSYWQLFTPSLSRPFRSTDHEPELMYVYPLQSAEPGHWRLRFGGIGLVHQSNGQSLPFSRSWNRAYLMAGADNGRMQLNARVWKRLPESAAKDDNPGISDFIGRAEARLVWHQDRRNLFAVTGRSALRSASKGSFRFEWFRTLWDDGEGPLGGLQLHTQLFTGYGDTLLDFNRRRTVFSIGLSLVDW